MRYLYIKYNYLEVFYGTTFPGHLGSDKERSTKLCYKWWYRVS
jgi:hypothetical protein